MINLIPGVIPVLGLSDTHIFLTVQAYRSNIPDASAHDTVKQQMQFNPIIRR